MCYISTVEAFSHMGRIALLPHSYLVTTYQIIRYFVMNLLSYFRLTAVYYHNILHVMSESTHDKEKF